MRFGVETKELYSALYNTARWILLEIQLGKALDKTYCAATNEEPMR
jgi:hypothetical protein